MAKKPPIAKFAWQVKPVKRLDNRDSSYARGYNSRWRSTRDFFLRQNPLCFDCLQENIIEPAVEVHHKKKAKLYPELFYDISNLLGLCKSCHSKRTAKGE